MTGNVAQVFTTDAEWFSALSGVRGALRPSGRFIFETRDPAKKAWLQWNRGQTYRRIKIAGVDAVEIWDEVLNVQGRLVSFRTTFSFESDGASLVSDSTLCFRERDEIEDSLITAGMTVEEVRDAPDRPGLEFVFIARSAGGD